MHKEIRNLLVTEYGIPTYGWDITTECKVYKLGQDIMLAYLTVLMLGIALRKDDKRAQIYADIINNLIEFQSKDE